MSNIQYIPDDLLAGWPVVVIDDEDDSLEVAQIILTHYGADVHTAQNGQDGFELIVAVRPRFVISDLSMPVMDGWQLIHKIKRDVRTQDIPVIALTAHAMHGDRERAIAEGFHNYLTKPLTVKTFIYDLVHLLVDIPVLASQLRVS